MMKIHYTQYSTYNWGFRFETPSVNGKRKWENRRGFKSKQEAKRIAEPLFELYIRDRRMAEISRMSLSDFLDCWLENISGRLQGNTIINYRKKIKNYIKPQIGQFAICSITHEQVQTFIDDMYNRGFAVNTISTIRGILSKAFNDALDRNLITYSPANRIHIPTNVAPKVPSRAEPHIYVPTDAMQKIYERFPEGSVAYLPLRLGYECGLRLGETYALCWEDIDFVNKTIFIHRQVQWKENKTRTAEEKMEAKRNGNRHKEDGGVWYFKQPKSKNSIRKIDISDSLANLLQRTKQAQEKADEYYAELYTHYYTSQAFPVDGTPFEIPMSDRGDYPLHLVMVREDGEYISPRTMQYASSVIRKNFCEGFDYHSLRGTHATMLREQGFDDLYITRRLGHSKMEITFQFYEKLSDAIIQQGKSKLNSMYSPEVIPDVCST